MGHIISVEGLKPYPEKVRAMKDMPLPETKEDVRRFLGSIQYLAKFLPKLRHHCGSSPERMSSSIGTSHEQMHSRSLRICAAKLQC